MPTVFELCDKLLKHHLKLGRQIDHILRGGLTPKRIHEMVSYLPFQLPETAIQLFTWRDGTKRGEASFDQMSLFPGYYLTPLYEAIYIYNLNIDMFPNRWNERWFPLFSASDSECLAVECSTDNQLDGPIIQYTYFSDQPAIIFDGLLPMLTEALSCFEVGYFHISQDSQLDGEFPRNPTVTQ